MISERVRNITPSATLGLTTRVNQLKKEGITVSLWPSLSVEDFVLACYLGADRLCIDVPLEVKKFMEEKMPWVNVVY